MNFNLLAYCHRWKTFRSGKRNWCPSQGWCTRHWAATLTSAAHHPTLPKWQHHPSLLPATALQYIFRKIPWTLYHLQLLVCSVAMELLALPIPPRIAAGFWLVIWVFSGCLFMKHSILTLLIPIMVFALASKYIYVMFTINNFPAAHVCLGCVIIFFKKTQLKQKKKA